MPKVKFEFNLPEEESDFLLALKGKEFFCSLWEIDQKCRSILKHGHDFKSVEDLAEYIRNMMPNLDDIN